MGLLDRIKRYAGTALLCSAALMSGCDKKDDEGKERFKGTPDQAVFEISTPKLAQDFVNKYIEYEDRNPGIRGTNGGDTYSLTKLLEEDTGLCRDGAVFAAASVKDDGFPSLILNRTPQDKTGHAVFVYQNPNNRDMNPKTPNWGSVGINKNDFREPQFTLDQIVQGIDNKFGYSQTGNWSLYDLSDFDLKNGFNGWVNVNVCPVFGKDVSSGQDNLSGSGYALPNGGVMWNYSFTSNGVTSHVSDERDKDQFGVSISKQIDISGDLSIDKILSYVITGRYPSGAKKTMFSSEQYFSSGALSERNEVFTEFYENSERPSIDYFDGFKIKTMFSYDSNLVLKSITQSEILPDGRRIDRFDINADGVWDVVQGP